MSYGRDIDELRGAFDGLRKRFERLCDASGDRVPVVRDRAAQNQSFKDETSLRAVRLLRSLESAASDAKLLADSATRLNAVRLEQELDAFRVTMEGRVLTRVQSTDVIGQFGQAMTKALGVPTGGHVTNYILKLLDAEQYCNALKLLSGVRGTYLGALEDIRMLYEHLLLPMEERDRIRHALAEVGMPEVAGKLAKADEERVDDPGACVGRCREALALTVHKLAEARTGRSTTRVEGDLAELSKTKGFLPREEGRLVGALYSSLSEKWKAGEEPGPRDSELALKLTYFFIERLLGTPSPTPAE